MKSSELYHQGRKAACASVAVTLTLGLAKLAGGLLGHSIALISDAVHSLGDALAAAAILAALNFAQRPADLEHPYGHTKAETVAGAVVAMLLMFSGVWVGWESIHSFHEPSPIPEAYTLAIAAISILLNEGLYRFSSRIAQKTGSTAVLASAWDQRLDAFGSAIVLAGLALAKWGGPAWHAADHVAAIFVALIILGAGGTLFWGSVQELLDRQAAPEMLDAVRSEAQAVPGVRGIEKLLVRKTGLEYLADIQVEVDPTLTVREGHAIGHAVKDKLTRHFVAIRDVLVHIEPTPE